ncbi:UDP-glucose 4-epimerase [Abditibacteriota bacterium]|nr:UDP-glucose 4-epimerase [Abditibacteriota bacterium]
MFWWKHKRALVIGASGFCGTHLCEALHQKGAHVIAFDRAEPNWKLRVPFERGDILDFSALRLLLERHPVDVVFHLAAQPIVSTSIILPLETMQTNVVGTFNVCEAIRLSSTRPPLVFASSGAFYGATNATEAIGEDDPAQEAANIYAPTKAAADLAVRSYAKTYGLPFAVCRWMNTYGEGDLNWSRVVPATFRRANVGLPGLIAATDGTNVLELLHVRDMVEAYLRVAENIERPKVKGEAFNFGGGEPLVLKDVVERITRAWNEATGQDVPETPEILGGRVQSAKYLDIAKAKRVLGWEPKIDLDEGLRHAAQWYQAEMGPLK